MKDTVFLPGYALIVILKCIIMGGAWFVLFFPVQSLYLSRFNTSFFYLETFTSFFIYVFTCIGHALYACAYGFPQYPGEDIESDGARVTGNFEPSDLGTRNQTWVLWKSSQGP